MIKFIYKWLPIFFGCHCRPDRSFFISGKQFPICARCTGELVGMFLCIFSYHFIKFKISIYILLMIPLILDGFIQLLTNYESTNLKRFITGLLFGYSLLSLFIISNVFVFKLGQDLAINYLK